MVVERSDLASATSFRQHEAHPWRAALSGILRVSSRARVAAGARRRWHAPHIVRPMRFILPHVEGLRPRWQIRLGLFFYDHVGLAGKLPSSRGVRLAGRDMANRCESRSHTGSNTRTAPSMTVDSVILNAVDAAKRGATIHTRTQFVSAQRVDGRWLAECRSTHPDRTFQVSARAIVNASGPWVDRVLQCLPGAQSIRDFGWSEEVTSSYRDSMTASMRTCCRIRMAAWCSRFLTKARLP